MHETDSNRQKKNIVDNPEGYMTVEKTVTTSYLFISIFPFNLGDDMKRNLKLFSVSYYVCKMF